MLQIAIPIAIGLIAQVLGVSFVLSNPNRLPIGLSLLVAGAALILSASYRWVALKGRHWFFALLTLVPPAGLLTILLLEYRFGKQELDKLIEDASKGRLAPVEEGPEETRQEKLSYILKQLQKQRDDMDRG